MNDICIKIAHLSKRFFVPERKPTVFQVLKSCVIREPLWRARWVLNDLSCEIKKGEKVAIIGRNGCGKTTLLRILAGIYEANSGMVHRSAMPLAMFRSSIGLNANISVIDNIYWLGAIYGLSRNDLNSKVDAILERAGISDLQFSVLKKLSTGQIQRLALSIFFEVDGDLLILDEASESVDLDFSQKSDAYFKKIAGSNKTLIMTSHQSATLRKYCSRAIWIDKGRVRMHDDFEKVNEEYEKSFLQAQNN